MFYKLLFFSLTYCIQRSVFVFRLTDVQLISCCCFCRREMEKNYNMDINLIAFDLQSRTAKSE